MVRLLTSRSVTRKQKIRSRTPLKKSVHKQVKPRSTPALTTPVSRPTHAFPNGRPPQSQPPNRFEQPQPQPQSWQSPPPSASAGAAAQTSSEDDGGWGAPYEDEKKTKIQAFVEGLKEAASDSASIAAAKTPLAGTGPLPFQTHPISNENSIPVANTRHWGQSTNNESVNEPGRFSDAQEKINARKFEQYQTKATRDTSWDEVTTNATSDVRSIDSRNDRPRRPRHSDESAASGLHTGYGTELGAIIEANDGIDRWWLSRRPVDPEKDCTVWVARIPVRTLQSDAETMEVLRKTFAHHGESTNIRILRNQAGNPTGAHVCFATPQAAESCLRQRHHTIQVRQEAPFSTNVEKSRTSCDSLFIKIVTRHKDGPISPGDPLSLQPLPATIPLDIVPQAKRNGELAWRPEIRPLNPENRARRDQEVMDTTGVPCEQGPVVDCVGPDKEIILKLCTMFGFLASMSPAAEEGAWKVQFDHHAEAYVSKMELGKIPGVIVLWWHEALHRNNLQIVARPRNDPETGPGAASECRAQNAPKAAEDGWGQSPQREQKSLDNGWVSHSSSGLGLSAPEPSRTVVDDLEEQVYFKDDQRSRPPSHSRHPSTESRRVKSPVSVGTIVSQSRAWTPRAEPKTEAPPHRAFNQGFSRSPKQWQPEPWTLSDSYLPQQSKVEAASASATVAPTPMAPVNTPAQTPGGQAGYTQGPAAYGSQGAFAPPMSRQPSQHGPPPSNNQAVSSEHSQAFFPTVPPQAAASSQTQPAALTAPAQEPTPGPFYHMTAMGSNMTVAPFPFAPLSATGQAGQLPIHREMFTAWQAQMAMQSYMMAHGMPFALPIPGISLSAAMSSGLVPGQNVEATAPPTPIQLKPTSYVTAPEGMVVAVYDDDELKTWRKAQGASYVEPAPNPQALPGQPQPEPAVERPPHVEPWLQQVKAAAEAAKHDIERREKQIPIIDQGVRPGMVPFHHQRQQVQQPQPPPRLRDLSQAEWNERAMQALNV